MVNGWPKNNSTSRSPFTFQSIYLRIQVTSFLTDRWYKRHPNGTRRHLHFAIQIIRTTREDSFASYSPVLKFIRSSGSRYHARSIGIRVVSESFSGVENETTCLYGWLAMAMRMVSGIDCYFDHLSTHPERQTRLALFATPQEQMAGLSFFDQNELLSRTWAPIASSLRCSRLCALYSFTPCIHRWDPRSVIIRATTVGSKMNVIETNHSFRIPPQIFYRLTFIDKVHVIKTCWVSDDDNGVKKIRV
ncbi:hypothetical protein DFJ58DRAFT_842815 [Suillus subalutaceus]|uniref:uncharacterized protein n=1 Tax=Suillus subalutaceus TaxID=48586 RepID=UPI001B86FEBF|nr:uncharacterized protein DFJ58DRAFT_842815 [Suillus subalutaceus]KAG1848977.1 hypothetical protein DFJ58DRAFT_842815 [Suillus subalutaceus]